MPLKSYSVNFSNAIRPVTHMGKIRVHRLLEFFQARRHENKLFCLNICDGLSSCNVTARQYFPKTVRSAHQIWVISLLNRFYIYYFIRIKESDKHWMILTYRERYQYMPIIFSTWEGIWSLSYWKHIDMIFNRENIP